MIYTGYVWASRSPNEHTYRMLSVPPDILGLVFDMCTFESQLSLRSTCTSFSKFAVSNLYDIDVESKKMRILIKAFPLVKRLNLSGTSGLQSLPALQCLTELDISQSEVSDIRFLTNLRILNISYNMYIRELPPMPHLQTLQTSYCVRVDLSKYSTDVIEEYDYPSPVTGSPTLVRLN